MRVRGRKVRVAKKSIALSAALVVLASLGVGAPYAMAQGGGHVCTLPPYMEVGEPPVGPRDHFHPNLLVIMYLRDAKSAQRRHDVTKIITAPGGIGIDLRPSEAAASPRPPAYRRIHSHDDSGVLHVEPAKGVVFRLCQLFKLWSAGTGPTGGTLPFALGKTAHVRIGDAYTRNMPVEQVMRIPLNHNLPIVLFVQDAEPM